MKKFLGICIGIFIITITSLNFIDEKHLKFKDLDYFIKVDNKKILLKENDTWNEFEIRGVNIDESKPGEFSNYKNITKEEYLRWFSYISDMGANSIRVKNLLSSEFYVALDEFNDVNQGKELYIFQGIGFDDIGLKDGYDLQKEELENKFITNIENTIDAVHGNLNDPTENTFFDYNADISKYIIGYTVGNEWASHDIIYTEIMNNINQGAFEGDFIYTNQEASSFEKYLAYLTDILVSYENDNYKEQRLLSFIGSAYSIIDTVSSNEIDEHYYNIEQKIKNDINIENIKYKETFKPGIVASYNIYQTAIGLREYKEDFSSAVTEINKFHRIPVIVSEYGTPSSRIAINSNNNPVRGITEEEQGQEIARMYQDIKNAGFSGSFIANFKDDWSASSWNTKDEIILDKSPYWSNPQTYGQSYGLLTFEPGNRPMYPDENISEWRESDKLSEKENVSLYMENDEKYIYFMINLGSKHIKDHLNIALDIDITPNSGSNISSALDLRFEKPVDFIIDIYGVDNPQILIHEYYSTHKFNDDYDSIKLRPDTAFDQKSIDSFIPIEKQIGPKIFSKKDNAFIEEVTYNTGSLIHGNTNPSSVDYNSIADYYIGENYIELRVPYALLNFMDPSTNKIHDDYFSNFKISELKIDAINVGVTVKKNNELIRVESKDYNLQKWVKPNYTERLKKSYFIIQDAFLGEGIYGN